MALDPHKLKPAELVRLMNSTPLGETLTRDRAYRQRDQGGIRVGDGQSFDLVRYAAWLFLGWKERRDDVRSSMTRAERHLIDEATGVEYPLGFIPEDDIAAGNGEIADVPLPDGDYEIEARPASYFWPDARPATGAIYRLRADATPERELPAVVDLRAEMTRDYWRVLSWSVAGADDAGDFAFGVWLGDEAPDLAGNPAATLA